MLENSNQILSSQRRKTKPIFWCKTCGVPLLKIKCENCGNIGEKICSDLKPMFKKECKFLEREIGRKLPGKNWEDGLWMRYKTIWYNGERLFRLSADGKPKVTKEYPFKNSPPRKKPTIQILKKANYSTLIKKEKRAIVFICRVMKNYPKKLPIISFSGGKDSSVVSNLVRRARRTNKIVHIFGDTTIEYPDTYRYIKRFRRNNPTIPFKITRSKNKFIDMCKKLEPPTVVNRWCCSVFKTSPLASVLNAINKRDGVLNFEGIRKTESASRRTYKKIYRSKKIANQISVELIFEWKDIDVWLYILVNKLDFNDAYRKGTTRVGCMYCPSNSPYTDFLLKNMYQRKMQNWFYFLISFAKKVGRKNPKDFVNSGAWKINIGVGNEARPSKFIGKSVCSDGDNIMNYFLSKNFSQEIVERFKPFGTINEIRDPIGKNFIVRDFKTNKPIFEFQGVEKFPRLKIIMLTNKDHFRLTQRIESQMKKYQSCILCGGCTGICPTGAIKVGLYFQISTKECVYCGRCLTSKYLRCGCVVNNLVRSRFKKVQNGNRF